MTNTFIIILCALLIILWAVFYKIALQRHQKVAGLLIGASGLYEFIMVVVPSLYSVFDGYNIESNMFALVLPIDILRVLFGEFLFVLFFLVGFVFIGNGLSLNYRNAYQNKFKLKAEYYTITLLIAFGLFIYLWQIFQVTLGENQLVTHITTVFWYASPAVCVFVLFDNNYKKNILVRICAVVVIISLLLISFIYGVRGRILWVATLFVFAVLYYDKKQFLILPLIFVTSMLPIFVILGTPQTRFEILGKDSPIENLSAIYDIVSSDDYSVSESLSGTLESFINRAQGVRNSVVLYSDHENGGGGFGVYSGLITTIIPSSFYLDKPLLGSVSSDFNGMAMYKVIQMGYNRDGEMGPFLASAHAFWEGGWIWLIFAGVLTGLAWSFIFTLSQNCPNVLRMTVLTSFAASSLIDGFSTMLNPIYSEIYMTYRTIIPLLLIYGSIAHLLINITKRGLHDA